MFPRKNYTLPLQDGRTLRLGDRTLVMGIVNVTPDSFADGGLRFDPAHAIADALRMEADGADILDIGGESTRPGSEPITTGEELDRIQPVLEGLAGRVRVPISVDTYKANVARVGLACGASIVNDISGLQSDPTLADVVAEYGALLVRVHNRGRSNDMYKKAIYDDLISEIKTELSESIDRAVTAGVSRERLILDPGLGFAKRAVHSYRALARLDSLASLDRPLLVGPSCKSFLKSALGDARPEEREWGTAAAVAAAVLLGGHIVRVHQVREMAQVVKTTDLIRHHQFGNL